ncbi:iron(III) transport system substrate-binding protein [Rhodovulum imhoffii]|uniref:Iron(III) transport system substrate-binding protein n=1 Tax=Rhodovulum imhoffii TaxID=365340 RepID=A0A2T5BVM0_9RHOB|nr:Fe(3+) ABC transporter substrate-binding protein [Rhodovulum imhoffii]MBK5932807.1 iron ABC transporter substrate-binding protein [Rhodovulum imhoffii]PTN03624.1 iron(III) transport system substrate-binding protein [Rhodovulum imhoffii]
MTRSLILGAVAAATVSPVPAMADVNIYSYRQPELIRPLLDAFTEQTGIETNVAFLSKGMVERLLAEGERSPADVILTVDISRLAEAVEAGVTQPVQSDVLNDAIPAEFRDPDGNWFGLTTRARIVYASKDRVDPAEITTYEDLADPKWQGRICTRSGTHAYNLALVAAMLHHHGEEVTRTWLEGVKANLARKPQGNDRAQVKAIWAGECDISLGNTYYMGMMLTDEEQKDWANAVNVLFPKFENGGTHVNVSGVALTKSAPNRDEAIRLIEFLASGAAQEIYAEVNYEYPVGPGTEASDLVRGWGNLTSDDVNLMDLSSLRADALRLVEETDFDG